MIVLRARELGMCFGVRDALATLAALPDPRDVTIHGELVHNPIVQRRLAARGFRRSPEADRPLPTTPAALVTAHGISDRERRRLQAAGVELIDTTCPLVEKAHDAARSLAADDRALVVLGKHGHVEVQGIVEDHPGAVVVERHADVRDFGAEKLGVLCQTTLPTDTAEGLLAAIRRHNPRADVRFVDTICAPTKARQEALRDLLERVDALVVVGGSNSNNTRKLTEAARAAGVAAFQVEQPDDLDLARLRTYRAVGLTAGTSTLPETIDAVEHAMRAAVPV